MTEKKAMKLITLQDLLATIPNTRKTWKAQCDLAEKYGGTIVYSIIGHFRAGKLTSKQVQELNDWLDSESLSKRAMARMTMKENNNKGNGE